jgi:monovalent cation:H+ antiporter-2, CPA2 family
LIHRHAEAVGALVNGSSEFTLYREALVFLVIAGVVAPLFVRLRVSPILGFLLAGAALGPFGLGALQGRAPALSLFTLGDMQAVDTIAAFGIVALLFAIGLELSFERLSRMRNLIFGLGMAQVAASTALGMLAAWALGQAPQAALVIGAALAMSSTAIVVPLYAESGRATSAAARASFAILLFQDLAVAPLLVLIAVMGGNTGGGFSAVAALLTAAVGLGLIILVGRLALRPLMQFVAAGRSPELFMAACLLVALGSALASAAAGLSMAMGALVAGLLLAETEYRRAIEATIEPFKGLLLGLFFVSVGAELDLRLALANAPLIALIVIALIAGKGLVAYLAARAFRLGDSPARVLAAHIAPGGEFAFVAFNAAVAAGVLGPSIAATLNVAVALTMALLPLLSLAARRFAPDEPHGLDAEAMNPPADERPRVLLVGYGRVGSLIGEMLDVHKIPFLAVDSDAALVARERKLDKAIYYGDAANPEFLKRCGGETARAVVVTTHTSASAEAVVDAARALRADLPIIARARDADHARTLYQLGVTDAVPETIEASLQLSEATLVDLGVPMGLVIASIHEKRDEFRRALVAAGAPDRPRTTRRLKGK